MDAREHVRTRPSLYVGSTQDSFQLLLEAINNSSDEVKIGNGNVINIEYHAEDEENIWYNVSDEGQGIIVNHKMENGKTILENAFSELNTSGKLKENQVYVTSSGLYGLGAKLITFLSDWCEITSYRDKKYEFLRFEHGVLKERKNGKSKKPHGVDIKYKPSSEIFNTNRLDVSRLRKMAKEMTCLCYKEKLRINFLNNGQLEVFQSKKGMEELINTEKELLNKRFKITETDGINGIDAALTFQDSYESSLTIFVNANPTKEGVHFNSLKSYLTQQFNSYFREKKWLKDKDVNFSGGDLQEGLVLIANITTNSARYDAQTKNTVSELNMTPIIEMFGVEFKKWLAKNPGDVKKIFQKADKARKTREAVKKARDLSRGKKTKQKNLDLPTKLVDCTSKERERCKLFIVEGDSAGGGLVQGRDPILEAVYPLRGKMLNLLKSTPTKILANKEVQGLIKALGLEVNEKGKLTYDKELLRYGKIVIATDADPDGAHIRLLIVTALWRLCPELIINGHLYSVYPPLFRITTSKDYIYLDNDIELENWKRENLGTTYQVSRFKGLGEMSSEELSDTLLNADETHLKHLTVSDIDEFEKLLNILMGTEEGGYEFLEENADNF